MDMSQQQQQLRNPYFHHPQLQQHNSLPGNYSTMSSHRQQQSHLDLSLNSTLSSGTFPYNAVMPSNEIISCPLTSNNHNHHHSHLPAPPSFSSSTASSSSAAVFFKSSTKNTRTHNNNNNPATPPVRIKFLGNIFSKERRKRQGSSTSKALTKKKNPKQSLDKTNSYLLWIGTPVAASFSVAVIVAALAGPQWLYSEEKLVNENYNGTWNFNAKDHGAYVSKYTKSSLWLLCTKFHEEVWRCSKIDYFPTEDYSPDPNDSTMAIPYAVTKSTPFFLISGLVLLVSYILFILATCSHNHTIQYFISGVLFIISGLLMLIGLIMYISIFKAEIGSKLRPKSSFQSPLFVFNYGQSFFLYVLGFIFTEFVGVLNVFLYITLEQVGGHKKTVPCFNVTSVAVGKMLNGKDLSSCASSSSIAAAQEVSFIDHLIPKHPNSHHKFTGSQGNGIYPHERRFFFAKSNGGKQRHQPHYHSHNHQLAMQEEEEREQQNANERSNQLQTDSSALTEAAGASGESFRNAAINKGTADASGVGGAVNSASPPDEMPSSTTRTLFPFDLPQEFPLTRTVSTSTDLNQNSDSELNYCGILLKHVNKSTTTAAGTGGGGGITSSAAAKTATKGILKGQVGGCGGSGGGTSSKGNDAVDAANQKQKKKAAPLRRSEELFNEFCKKTGRFIRPKNIYYIDNRDEEEEEEREGQGHGGNEDDDAMLHTRLSQQSLNQIRRSKSFHEDQPLYYSHFDRERTMGLSSSPRNVLMYQSQTLPRNFMKGSQSQLHIPHISRQFVGGPCLNRSFDNFLTVSSPFHHQHHHQQMHPQQTQGLIHPQQLQQQHHNWPKCIPTSPRAFYPGSNNRIGNLYASASRESLGKIGGGGGGQEFNGVGAAFDLDQIEKECRMSHASLFQAHNGFSGDYSKSTAV